MCDVFVVGSLRVARAEVVGVIIVSLVVEMSTWTDVIKYALRSINHRESHKLLYTF